MAHPPQEPYPNHNYAPQPSQPYAYTQPPHGSEGPYVVSDSKNEEYGARFQPKRKINDPIFLILFIIQLAGFAVVSALALQTWLQQGGLHSAAVGSSPSRPTNPASLVIALNGDTAYLLLIVTGAALILSSIYLIAVRAFTKTIMHITLILTIILNCGLAIYYWVIALYSAAIIFTVIALISVFAYWGYRSRIPLATLLLQVTMDISKHHKSVYVVAFIGLIFQAGLSVWFAFTAIATYSKWSPGNPSCSQGTSCSSAAVTGLIIYELFSYIWTSQVISNLVLATLAGGPYGSWYYFGPAGQGMPPHPTRSAFLRASTLSLGSIAFGSLIVAILELIRVLIHIARSQAQDGGNPVLAIIACCAECFIGCIESMVEYFNRYAYIEIALYGKPYIAAAKDTWRLFMDRGIDALVNDSLVAMTLTWGAYIVALLCLLFAWLYLKFTNPAYNVGGQYTAPVMFFAFLIGLQCSLTLSSAIDAGVSTLFVGMAEDPQILLARAPALFEMIRMHYPQIVAGVHGSV